MSWPGVEIGVMLPSRFLSSKFVCVCTGLLVVFGPPALLRAADGDAGLTVNGGLNTITDTEVFTGELYPLTVGDVGYESTTQRNAVVVMGGGELKLSSGADVWVKNDDNHTAFLRVGYGSGSSGDGTLTIESGAMLRVGSTTRYANFQLGQGVGVTGTVNQTGGAATFIGSLNVGVNGGTGIYNVSGGTLTFDNAGAGAANQTSLISIGFNNSISGTSSGTMNISGGLVQVTAPHDGGSISFIIGNAALNALQAYSGSSTNDGNAGAGNGTVTQTGGTFLIGAGGTLYLSAYGNGTYNLNGGTLQVGGTGLQPQYGNHSEFTYAFNLGGGTIQVTGSALTTSVDANLVGGATSTIDTNGLNATWSGNLAGAGLHQIDFGGNLLVKTGAGTLTFSGASRVLDSFAVTGGSVDQTAGNTSAVEFMVGTGTSNTGAYVMDGGTLMINPSTRVDNVTAVAGSFRVGDFGGTGTFTQNAGTVTVMNSGALNIGNQGGTGTYNLSGGTLALNAGNHVVGRSTSGKPASTGTMNVSGGTLVIDNGGHLILGNNIEDAGTNFGTGTLTQTGGIIRISNGNIYVGASGDGTYNLNGGTLEVSGAGLQGRYGSGAAHGESNFNLGGGTIKAISAMTTSISATLTAATISGFDTNGFDATWSGLIAGTGGLNKTGAGTLTLSGATRAFGLFNVAGGVTAQTAGATTSGEFLVGSGTGADGTFNLGGGTLTLSGVPAFGGSAASLRIGDFGGTGVFNQTNGTVSVTGSLNLGNQGGSGTYNLSGGTLSLGAGLHDLGRTTGSYAASSGTLNLSGGLLELTASNARLILGDREGDGLEGTGVLTQTGGILRVTAGDLWLSSRGNGTYNLNGGSLEVGGSGLQTFYSGTGTGTGTYAFNLGGGTIKVINSDLTTSANATLTDATTSTVDTNGLNATFSGTFAGTGGLVKKGSGTLTLSGATRAFGFFNGAAGVTAQATGATTSGEFLVGSGTGANGGFNLSGGTLTVSGLSAFGGAVASLRVGDLGGTGVFNQTGGTVSVTGSLNLGNQGGSGTYNLSAGTLSLGAGLHDLGYTTGSHSAGSGTLNVSGGVLELTDAGSHLILGDSDGDGNEGAGVLTQTGGVVRISAGDLSLSSRGNGTYNLNGGTLEVGGSGLQAFYAGAGTGTGTAAFNLGGGTIKVIGSSLVTTVAATLATGTTSTVNTNGFDATLSGLFTGQGGLTKTGSGTLFLTGASDYSGATTVSTGTLHVDGSLTNTGISVASGATFTGHGTVHDLSILGGGNLVQGGTAGELSVTGNLTLATTSYTLLGIASDSSYDRITVDGTLFAGGVLDVQFLGGFDPLSGASFDLFDGAFSGTFSDVWLPALDSGLEWNTSNLYASGVISVETTPIPEPATWTAILAGAALVVVLWRRRRVSAAL